MAGLVDTRLVTVGGEAWVSDSCLGLLVTLGQIS